MEILRGSIHKTQVTERRSLLQQMSGPLAPPSPTCTWGQRSWIEKTFQKRECCKFIRSTRDHTKCCCGRPIDWHASIPREQDGPTSERWHPYGHTEPRPTDAYGTIEFQGAPHPSKAQYVRLSSFDTKSEKVLQLLQKHWGLELPKLLITVHGGILNFDLQPKLKRVFRKGLLKAAKTTGAWIITSGTNTGVTRHVGDTISDRTTKLKNKVVAIGIAPWGIVENKEDLLGKDVIVPYHCVSSPKTNYAVLNSNHSYFLLVDNGTVGKYGGEIIFRKRLEKYIAQQKISIASGVTGRGVPVICVVLEGGANTIRSVLEYVTDSPPVPVVVCDGSGRAADLLAFTHKYTSEDGTMPESLRDQLILTIQKTFQYTQEQAEKLFIELMLCVKKRELITVFRMGEGAQDIDLAILTALLKGTNASAPDQLNLALTWDRVDIARSHIFVYGQEWPEGSLEQAMMDALINDRVDFVKLLLENGVSMHTFLTIARLEELYNTRHGPSNTLRFLVRDTCIRKHVTSSYRYTLIDIGCVIEHLMDGAFRASYCRKRFRQKYYALRKEVTLGNLSNLVTSLPSIVNTKKVQELFPYPFHDLMIWAVLMKRQKMALFMWQHGEEAMAKALMACKLYKAMAHEADQDDLEVDISDELRSYAQEFQQLALELLEHCYKIDDDYTMQLLTYELKNFSDQTCLSLAVAANHRAYLAHTCCQILLNDMWMGGLQMRKNSSLKVIIGLLVPFYIGVLEFKSKEQLQLMPQTMEEHLDELDDLASDIGGSMSFSDIEDDQGPESMFMDDNQMPAETSFHSSPVLNLPKENGSAPNVDTSLEYPTSNFRKRKSPLKIGKKIYEFYNAPITKFWFYTLFYFFFLIMFTYTVLVKTYPEPKWPEYFLMAYIFTLAVEKLRQVIASEPVKLSVKLRVHFSQLWNLWDCLAILMFTIGVTLRSFPQTLKASRIVYTVNIVLWFTRLLEILSVNKYLGPYVKIIGKLLRDMSYFIVILFIVLISFGVVRQAIHFQDEEPSWFLVRSMLFYPYWMIYGELFADEIDTCTDEVNYTECVYGSWVAPALMCIYLLVANILLVNLLIARFNATFIRNNINSREIWKFQRYQLIINYELRPILPPPLIFFSHVYLAMKFIIRKCRGKRDIFDDGLKLFLSHEDTEKLHDFEEECVEDYFRDRDSKYQTSQEERVRIISERVENMTMRMDDVNQKENSVKLSLQTMDYRLSQLEDTSMHISDSLNHIRVFMTRGLRHISASSNSTFGTYGRNGSQESIVQESDLVYDEAAKIDPTLQQEQHMQTPSRQGSRDKASEQGQDRLSVSESNATMRSIPSPILVHTKKPVVDEQLRRFTDFSKLQLQRQGSAGRRSAGSKGKGLFRSTPSSGGGTAGVEDGSHESHNDKTSLKQRRHVSDKLVVDVDKANHVNDAEDASTQVPSVFVAASVEPIPEEPEYRRGVLTREDAVMENTNQSAAIYTTAKMELDTSLSTDTSALEQEQIMEPNAKQGVTIREGHPNPLSLYLGSPTETNEQNAVPTPLAYFSVGQVPLGNPPYFPSSMYEPSNPSYPKSSFSSALSQLTPILTSLQSEYTTITDEIDTSCVVKKSPPGSPSTAGTFFGDSAFPGRKTSRNETSEIEMLKQAEEVEHRKMEKVIRHRLRQISLDETDSISDIARIVVSELRLENCGHDEEEEEEDEDVDSHGLQKDESVISIVQKDIVEIRIRQPSTDNENATETENTSL